MQVRFLPERLERMVCTYVLLHQHIKTSTIKYTRTKKYLYMTSTKMSDRMTALLTSYTLCNKAMEHGRVLKEHVTESMFHTGIIVYYSIFKNQREKQWFKSTLSNPPMGLSV